jgi:hydrogenase maturation protein HypF
VVSCIAENGRDDRVIGIALDGTGYGPDGKIWGGEILAADTFGFERLGHFAYRPMPGGTAAVRDPWRMAISYLDAAFRDETGTARSESEFMERISPLPLVRIVGPEKIRPVRALIHSSIPMPETSSLGRLFDAMAAIAGIRFVSAYEGQAACELEMATEENNQGSSHGKEEDEGYAFNITESDGIFEINPDPVIRSAYLDVIHGVDAWIISRKFHLGLIRTLVEACQKIRTGTGLGTAALSGGCFQNRFLLEGLAAGLRNAGFEVLHHSLIPCNDGGLALGQAVAAGSRIPL